MAYLTAEVKTNFKPLTAAVGALTNANGKFLAYVGSKARTALRKEFLSGQEITLTKLIDDAGRRTIRSDVNKFRTQTKIYAYPVNLFENGRTLRDGRREAPKQIITKKLKGTVESRMSGYISVFEKKFIEPELREVGL